MAQPYTGFRPNGSAQAGTHAADAAPPETAIREAEARVREQEAHVLRLIVQGAPTQTAEDLLRQLTTTAQAMRERFARRRP
jgi:hypothetical protein